MQYDLKIFSETVGEKTLNQIYNLIAQPPFANSKVRIMPDVHVGIGAVVGFTAKMTDKIIPNVVGVDIGCGMLTTCINDVEIDLPSLDKFIKNNIPAGNNYNKKQIKGVELVESLYCFKDLANLSRLYGSLGTLGGGNHFIEVDIDDEQNKYLIVHSGSRNLGQQVASIYQKRAIAICKENPEKSKILKEFCYLDGTDMQAYLHDMKICQEFAKQNRREIRDKILSHLKISTFSSFETVHNYIDDKNYIRKGAVSSYSGERLLIPINMRDGCIIAIGKGNEDWNYSAPHGAGRLYSRSDAKKFITLDEFKDSMQSIYSTTVTQNTIDESPQAYKPIDEIVNMIQPTCDIEKIIKPIYNFKASS